MIRRAQEFELKGKRSKLDIQQGQLPYSFQSDRVIRDVIGDRASYRFADQWLVHRRHFFCLKITWSAKEMFYFIVTCGGGWSVSVPSRRFLPAHWSFPGSNPSGYGPSLFFPSYRTALCCHDR